MAFAILFWLGLGAGVVAALATGWHAQHGAVISASGLVVAAGIWIMAKVANDTDYRNADGWVDCWPSCTPLERGVGIGLFAGAVLMVASLLL
jgi:hypothetical protein